MKKILLIDDDPLFSKLIHYLLMQNGFQVFLAENGKEGLRIAIQELPDLILCDVMLQEMNGYEFAKEIRSIPPLKSTPLIAISGLGMPEDEKKALKAGFDSYFFKPIDPFSFIQQVENWL